MPMNLIEQMEILKGLSDQQLASEMASPTGGAAPFMVATELARRKDMRQRYMNEAARQRPQTTVIEDITMQMPQMQMPGMAPQMAGIGAAMPPMGGLAPQVAGLEGYAEGGVVDPYNAGLAPLIKRYQERLDGLDGQRDRAQAIALIAAGAGMMGGGSSNTMRNIGTGVNSGIAAYQTGINDVDSREEAILRNLADLQQTQMNNARMSAATMSQTPIFLSDGTNMKVGQISSRGGVLIDGVLHPGVPDGLTVVNRPEGYQFRDTGTAVEAFDPNVRPAGPLPAVPVAPIDNSGKAFDAQLGGDIGKQVADLRSKASEARQSLEANERTLKLLDDGAITGFGADFRLGFGKALQMAGFNVAKDEIANTEAFVATRAQEVGRLITMFGAGTGLSDKDREYAEKAAAGTINLTEESIRRIIELNNIAAKNIIERYDAIAGDLGDRGSIPTSVIQPSPPRGAQDVIAPDDETDALVQQYLTP